MEILGVISDEVLRETVASSMNDFRSSWFTFNGLQRSIIFMMSPLGALISMYPTWLLIMKHGYRRVCSTACLISTFLTSFLPWSIFYGFPFVLTIQFLLGATAPSAILLVPSVIRKWSTRKNDHFCFLILSTFQQISPSFVFPIAALISKSFFGWPVIFYFQSIISFIVTIVFFYFYKETPIRHANVSDNELEKIQRNEVVRGNIDYKIVHLVLKIFISRIFEKNPLLTNFYSVKFLSFASFTGPSLFMITFFFTKFHFDIQLIFYVAIFAFLSLSWPSVFKSSYIISNKYYLPVMVRTHIVLFYFASFISNFLPLVFGRKEKWDNWRLVFFGYHQNIRRVRS
uniref:Cytochrome C n=1 Tax=Caenorhabditis tropicalis TaxID=1561998 RepID=A0A1I7U608_9PELO